MSKNKGYNSILFLTTLSVYLGLVLVGASPSVLAQQAALTQRFEIQNEFEIEDDLDKKPDDESFEQVFFERLDVALNEFVEELRELKRSGKYKKKGSFSTGFYYNHCSENNSDAGSSVSFDEDKILFEPVMNFRKKLDIGNNGRNLKNLPDFIEPIQNGNESCKWFGAGISIDKSELEVYFKFSQNSQTALITAENLDTIFSIKAVNAQNALIKQFYENTKSKAENQYVIVTTNLPRGSLNAFVKSEKQAN